MGSRGYSAQAHKNSRDVYQVFPVRHLFWNGVLTGKNLIPMIFRITDSINILNDWIIGIAGLTLIQPDCGHLSASRRPALDINLTHLWFFAGIDEQKNYPHHRNNYT